jgi:hypothetical protein
VEIHEKVACACACTADVQAFATCLEPHKRPWPCSTQKHALSCKHLPLLAPSGHLPTGMCAKPTMHGRPYNVSKRPNESPTGTSTGLCRPEGNTCMHQSPAHPEDSQDNCQPGTLMRRDRVQQAAYPQLRFALRWVYDAAAEAAAARCCAVLCGVQEKQKTDRQHRDQLYPRTPTTASKQYSQQQANVPCKHKPRWKRSIPPNRSTQQRHIQKRWRQQHQWR